MNTSIQLHISVLVWQVCCTCNRTILYVLIWTRNVYSRIGIIAFTAMVLRSSCLCWTNNVHKRWGLGGEAVNFVLFPIKFFCNFLNPFWIFQGLGDRTSWLLLVAIWNTLSLTGLANEKTAIPQIWHIFETQAAGKRTVELSGAVEKGKRIFRDATREKRVFDA